MHVLALLKLFQLMLNCLMLLLLLALPLLHPFVPKCTIMSLWWMPQYFAFSSGYNKKILIYFWCAGKLECSPIPVYIRSVLFSFYFRLPIFVFHRDKKGLQLSARATSWEHQKGKFSKSQMQFYEEKSLGKCPGIPHSDSFSQFLLSLRRSACKRSQNICAVWWSLMSHLKAY